MAVTHPGVHSVYLLQAYRAARRWTLSRQLISSVLYGPQDVEAYSIVGRTMDLYVVARTCLLQFLKLRLRKPSVREAWVAVASVCFSH